MVASHLHSCSSESVSMAVSLTLPLVSSPSVIIPASMSSHQSISPVSPLLLPLLPPFNHSITAPVLPPVAKETAVYSAAVHLLTLSFYYLRVRFLIRKTGGVSPPNRPGSQHQSRTRPGPVQDQTSTHPGSDQTSTQQTWSQNLREGSDRRTQTSAQIHDGRASDWEGSRPVQGPKVPASKPEPVPQRGGGGCFQPARGGGTSCCCSCARLHPQWAELRMAASVGLS